jgi:hypothetical protein
MNLAPVPIPQVAEKLIKAVLRHGGTVAVLNELYLDESGSHEDSPVLCLAGFVFDADHTEELAKEWQLALDGAGVSYFRMSACAHGNEPFDKIGMNDRIALEKELIAIVRARMTFGFAFSVVEKEYERQSEAETEKQARKE